MCAHRRFAGRDPPAAVVFYSRDGGGEHPEQYLGELCRIGQRLYRIRALLRAQQRAELHIEAACWGRARRKLFDLARINKTRIAAEAVARIDALFAIEREINGLTPQERVRVRQERSRPLVIALES